VWYLMLADCSQNSHLTRPEMPMIEIEILAFNDKSHFSEEHQYLGTINMIVFALLVYFLGLSAYKMFKEAKTGESFE